MAHFVATSDAVVVYSNGREHRNSEANSQAEHTAASYFTIGNTTRFSSKRLTEIVLESPEMVNIAIQRQLQNEILTVTWTQIANLKSRLRSRSGVTANPSWSDLKRWSETMRAIPIDNDTCFVVKDDFDEATTFRLALTTRRLLDTAASAECLHVDTTSKLVWQGFTVLILGTTDANHVFHPALLAICSRKTADDFRFFFRGTKARMGGHRSETFTVHASGCRFHQWHYPFKRAGCWAHAIRAIDRKIEALCPRETKKELADDIRALQRCHSPN
ncbi:hypothetical protein PsorP6_015597 [Peronosclerospora sorghi]|uniref:Uncharacterized protein n=1 Tax=Peronosclerospora sorghi TaxID=230839 RepID=A0ACC0WQ92_9STRA|nr:hypothetical protein PsorP6_015597 [Peronosclerospora sorghi]